MVGHVIFANFLDDTFHNIFLQKFNFGYPEILKMNLKVQIINTGEKIEDSTDVALINSFGDLNKYYNYCKDVFVGKSLDKKNILTGGQNPIEAAKFGCKIYHGPYVYNFKEVYDFLKSNEMAEEILSSDELASKIINSFNRVLCV